MRVRSTTFTLATFLLGATSSSILANPRPHNAAPFGVSKTIVFEENLGQADEAVDFVARARGFDIFLTATAGLLSLQGEEGSSDVVHLRVIGGNESADACGIEPLRGVVNYLLGADSRRWVREAPTYGAVRYDDVYPGVDMVYRTGDRRLEFDFIVAPGADPTGIRLEIISQTSRDAPLFLTADGDLEVTSPAGKVRWRRPIAFQEVDGKRREVPVRFEVSGTEVRFLLGAYDESAPLVIDPLLVYSTFLGGQDLDEGTDIVVDADGNAYVVGFTKSAIFPTFNPLLDRQQGNDAIVTKLDSTGTALVYSTYLGGTKSDTARSVAIDAAGNVYVAGLTKSNDFPILNAFQPTRGNDEEGSDGFVAKIDPTGSALVYSTYLGGKEAENKIDIAIDAAGNAYLSGATKANNFPVANAFQATRGGSRDGFVAKLTPTGSALVYSTYLGAGDSDSCEDIVVDANGCAYVIGSTRSRRFPTVNPIQPKKKGKEECFVTKFAPDGQSLVFSTFFGGEDNDTGLALALDASSNIYITGSTFSNEFPTVLPVQPERQFELDVFVAKFDSSGSSVLYSTHLGAGATDVGLDIAVASDGGAVVVGRSQSKRFPSISPLQSKRRGVSDAFITRFTPTGDQIVFSTLLGGGDSETAAGLDLDTDDNIYITGSTTSERYPLMNPIQESLGSTRDALITKISPAPVHDLAVIEIKAPKRVTISAGKPAVTKRIKVKIQNRGQSDELIPDLATLDAVVTLAVQSLGVCPDIVPVLVSPKFPLRIKSRKAVTVQYDITIDCANDPAKNSKNDLGHEDFNCLATVDRSPLGDDADLHPDDDMCPRDALPEEFDQFPDGRIKNQGCGEKKPDGSLGADVVIDVRMK